MTNKEILLDAIDGTSCNAGLGVELDNLQKNLSAWIASPEAEQWRQSLLTTSYPIEEMRNCSGKENCKASAPCTTAKRRDEANR